MASLVESGLHNLTGGDRDSVGFFQMRTGIWDRRGLRRVPAEPRAADALVHRPRARDQGQADPPRATRPTARIRARTATGSPTSRCRTEPYRGRYQLRLDDARALLAEAGPAPAPATGVPVSADAAAGAAPAVPAADVAGPVIDIAPGVPVMDAQAASPTALNAIRIAAQYLGTPYHFGGASPETGWR